MTDYKALKADIDAKLTTLKEESKALLSKALQEIVSMYPTLECISWRQYTPYWNDGSPCNFYCYATDGEAETEWDGPAPDGADEAIADLLALFSDDDYMSMFGDHVTILITQDGITVEEYDHD